MCAKESEESIVVTSARAQGWTRGQGWGNAYPARRGSTLGKSTLSEICLARAATHIRPRQLHQACIAEKED